MKLVAHVAGLLVLGVGSLAWLGGCQTTEVTTVWKSPEAVRLEPFKKIVAIVLNATPGERRAGEDELAKQIRSAEGVAAYTFVPDAELKDREKVKASLVSNGCDGAVVLKLVATDRTTTYVAPTADYRSRGFYGGSYDDTPLYRGGYTVTDVIVRAEVSVYSVQDGKLLWTGTSGTTNPASVQDLMVQVANATREELRKQGMLK